MGAAIAGWGTRTAEARNAHAGRFETLHYGDHPRMAIDLYRVADGTAPRPLVVFIHGGFWKAVSAAESGFVVGGWTRRGVDVAVLDYVLAPEATLPEIVAQVRAGLAFIAGRAPALSIDPGRIVLVGHSVGAQLAAMSQCGVPEGAALPARGLVLVSGVFALEPVRHSYVNDTVRMTADDAGAFSPVRFCPARPLPLVVAVGEREPIAFHEQSRLFAWTWREAGCPVDFLLMPGRQHFDMLDLVADPFSPLGQGIARLLGA
ncbi:MAG TPA: alpha/beta hydrolase [Hyphomicrobiales bacterium]|nr:alpha/beta hydrolase [Hyphomicrobiales bacterium]